ncbi:MAG: DoxX family protein [Acidobacteriota bacterium]
MGLLKGRTEEYGSPLVGLPARLYTGYFFLKYGLAKATGGFGGESLRETLAGWVADSTYPFYVPFLTRVAIPFADLFALSVIVGEIVVGAAILAGFATRAASIVGMVMCLNFAFATGAPLLSTEEPVVFAVLLLTVYLTAAGRALGLDVFMKKLLPRWAA